MRKTVNTKKEEGKDKLMWIGQNKRRKKNRENRLVLGNGLGYDMSLNLYNSIWLIGPIIIIIYFFFLESFNL